MALSIIESCVSCFACEPLCPSNAIYDARPHFVIDAKNVRNVKVILRTCSVQVFAPLKVPFWMLLMKR